MDTCYYLFSMDSGVNFDPG